MNFISKREYKNLLYPIINIFKLNIILHNCNKIVAMIA